jgi:hypothetical protein
MLLSARILQDVASVNTFRPVQQLKFTKGDTLTIYFQLIDASLDTAGEGYNPVGRRYVPAAGATLSVVVDNIDVAKKVTKTATKPFSGDDSIWSISIASTDVIPSGTASLQFTLTESAKITKGVLLAALGVASQTNG